MTDLIHVTYAQTGQSSTQDSMGMREMQSRAFAAREEQYLLLKAPPASGKSRALMFLALDKVMRQGLRKAIIAVPEISIGGSFADTPLSKYGFYADWRIDADYHLCTHGTEGKVDKVLAFLDDDKAHYLLCTHATLRFAFERLQNVALLDTMLIAIDEFHHTSAEEGNKLGAMVDAIMHGSTAHIVAMTGSYFRGDQVPILLPEAEARFRHITYTYYEQLNGYTHLKSLGLGYHFYQGSYIDAVGEVLDVGKKTIIHIPNVNSSESTGFKYDEVDRILDVIGVVLDKDEQTGIMRVQAHNGAVLKVADLVTDDALRSQVLTYFRNVRTREHIDIIIALGMAKEGFDWPWCEHVLTIGYRASLTEVVQIIGRATRDCEGKSHAQFTNLIAQPDAEDEDVKGAVNNMLKAIALSLLMREVLAPNVTFRPRSTIRPGETLQAGDIEIDDTERPVSPRMWELLQSGGVEQVIATLINTPEAINPAIIEAGSPEVATEIELPKIITQVFPDLSDEDAALLHDLTKAKLAISAGGGLVFEEDDVQGETGQEREARKDGADAHAESDDSHTETQTPQGRRTFLRIGDRLINVNDLDFDLIDRVNPFQGAYEILSKAVTAPMLKTIQDHVTARRSDITEEEAVLLWPRIKEFKRQWGKEPSIHADNALERRMAEALAFMRLKKAQHMQHEA